MKRLVGKTYCYDDFITNEEQKILRQYILSIQDMMGHAVSNGYKKEYDILIRRSIGTLALKKHYNLEPISLVSEIKKRIVEIEDIRPPITDDLIIGDWFGITDEDAFVEPHTDEVEAPYLDYYTRRYNVIISMPDEGGQPIYDGDVLDVGERALWRCEAGLVKHASVPNVGTRMRLNISYGFYVPKNQQDAHQTSI
jgi:hypothetical protein